MTDPELFRYDVRVRRRMLTSGNLTQKELEQRLGQLPDVSANCEEM